MKWYVWNLIASIGAVFSVSALLLLNSTQQDNEFYTTP
jgi:hypothetical protein